MTILNVYFEKSKTKYGAAPTFLFNFIALKRWDEFSSNFIKITNATAAPKKVNFTFRILLVDIEFRLNGGNDNLNT